jgi:hypothetical protein
MIVFFVMLWALSTGHYWVAFFLFLVLMDGHL